ncbi:hypothetical protein TVAG_370950 [Trichomonas vaginalis G3]|uniref:Clan SC, family S33, methylesterase-like serine peptidase n=1 Tax=Trichomonas vaginalis (strain ATCC PRA-98 / G3) TaxID=412133 RepID=A2FHP7_TRIV3|nr:transmembrane protein 53 [Trichomonas vaginalis G3]EAX95591.1 hypothetical protein TVAG_370950 [Trichomonas vaginalis G3]KAI5486909.1 transmembrane protein 53 [Trichomonas vaginalis G3]|eukprot:XP_001308521.1 hypothetical protein [Trichomonas vaginalis G3]
MIASRKPLVLAFGWLGAKPYHMNSFKKIYNGIGLEYKSMVQSYMSILNLKDDHKKFEEMYEAAKNRDVLCHIFSLNGASSFLDSLMEPDCIHYKPNINVKAIVWDSSPGTSPKNIYHKAFAKSIFPKSPFLANALSAVLIPPFNLFLNLSKNHNARAQYKISSAYANPPTCPQLSLSSTKDYIIKHEDVVRYIENARKAGANVEAKFWEDSDHVMLYHDHKQEYIKIVQDFAKKIFPPSK